MVYRIGLIGVGGIMNGAHIPGYLTSQRAKITALCDTNPLALERARVKLSLDESACFADYRDLVASGLVDAVDIATPDYMHCPIAAEAVARNLPFSVEKPMGMNYAEVKAVCDAAKARGLSGHVCFSWHYRPYVRLMREKIASGALGELYHIYIRCIKDSGLWEGRRLEWRFDERYSASGVMGDLSSHMFDIARFAGREFVELSADAGIFVTERQEEHGERLRPVTTWDWCNVLARMEGGVNATFQISRTTHGVKDWMQVEFYGSKGRLSYVCRNGEPQKLIMQTDGEPVELIPDARYDAVQSEGFINIIDGTTDGLEPTLDEGLRAQAALDAAYRAVKEHRWVKISEITGKE